MPPGRNPSLHQIAVLFLCAVVAINPAPSRAAAFVTPDVEASRLEASYLQDERLIKDTHVDELLSRMVARLQSENPEAAALSVRIRVLRDVLPYAFTLDNGAVFISTGLIARLGNETQLVGLVAASLAAVVRHDAAHAKESQRQRGLRSFLPNVLLLTATVGIAGPSMNRSAQEATDRQHAELQAASDAAALQWLQRAGYDPGEVPRGAQRLLDALTKENRFGTTDLARRDTLSARVRSFSSGLPPPASAAVTMLNPTMKNWWQPMARVYALDIARQDVGRSDSVAAVAMLDAIDREFGPAGDSALLRAQLLRQTRTSEEQLPEVIEAYETAATFSGVPVEVWRELGFLYRRHGDTPNARGNFQHYLQVAPAAADAPIIRGYLEAL